MRIGIFGGTFDPIHDGHLYVAGVAREAAALAEVWFMPCNFSPHKTSAPSPSELRYEWLELATANLAWARVIDFELTVPGPSYSWQSAEWLVSTYPEHEFWWIVGADQWLALPRWSRPERLAELVGFVVVSRSGIAVEARPGWRMIHVECHEHPASASHIRQLAARGLHELPWLHPAVAASVLKHLQRP